MRREDEREPTTKHEARAVDELIQHEERQIQAQIKQEDPVMSQDESRVTKTQKTDS